MFPPSDKRESGEPEEIRQDAAQAQLNRMRQAAQARGNSRISPSRRKAGQRKAALPFVPGEYTGRDPQGVGKVFNRFVSERGWNSPVAVGSVISRWEELVGPEVSAHCKPESFSDTTVQVRCDSTAWATQLRLLRSQIQIKLVLSVIREYAEKFLVQLHAHVFAFTAHLTTFTLRSSTT